MIHEKEEAEILIDWFASLIQHHDERPMWSPLITSEVRGVGNDTVTDIFSSLFGHKYCKKTNTEILSKSYY